VVLSGTAAIGGDTPSADDHRDYLEKYAEHIKLIGMTPETFAEEYEVPVRIRLERVRGH
jgi:hypothetical protein